MRIDKTNDAFTFLFDIVLGQANELHIVIIQPLGVTFVQRLLPTRFFFIVLHQRHDPLSFVLAFSAIRRITYDSHHRTVALNHICFCGLTAEPLSKKGARFVIALFEGVGQIDMQTFL